MAMKWLRTAKPSVHSSRSLTALDEPLACERGTELMNAVPGKQARRLTRPMRSGGRDAAWCAHFERWYERWPLEKEEEDMRCESMYFYCVHEIVYDDDDDVLTMRFFAEVDKAEAELSKGTSPFHMLGAATTLFLRATLGFEKDIMAQAVLHFLSHSLIPYALILFLL